MIYLKNISKNKIKNAFSLIEISVVVLIIGILITGISTGIDMFNDAKIIQARNLTKNSRVGRLPDLMFWWETTFNESFIASEAIDGKEISQWNDINPQISTYKMNGYRGQKTNGAAFNYDPSWNTPKGPNYIANGINNLPSLRFPGTAGQSIYIQTDNKFKVINNKDLLLFIVLRYRSGNGWLIDRVCQNANGYGTACDNSSVSKGQPLFNIGITNGNINGLIRDNVGTSFLEIFSNNNQFLTSKSAFVITLERRFKKNFTLYMNGKQVAQATDNSGIIVDLDMVKLGRHSENNADNLNFDVSEFIYINGTVQDSDRDNIENYLGKKFNIKISNI
jgi:hypothetical protein